jgi:thymidylate synthase ThyX
MADFIRLPGRSRDPKRLEGPLPHPLMHRFKRHRTTPHGTNEQRARYTCPRIVPGRRRGVNQENAVVAVVAYPADIVNPAKPREMLSIRRIFED